MELARFRPDDAATKTYQYLRIGMVGVVVLLGLSIAYEIVAAGCVQPSISAYFFTPVRAMFVGTLMAIGAALIFISGRTLAEDVALSLAGFFAPVVAVVPITDVGPCWSTAPPADPTTNGELADWVVAGAQNNMWALLVMGYLGVVAVGALGWVTEGRNPLVALWASAFTTRVALGVIVGVLVATTWAYNFWDGFYDHAHGIAAVAMFGCLAVAVAINALVARGQPEEQRWFWAYAAIATAMVGSALVLWIVGQTWEHQIFIIEAVQIALFVAFWVLQTVRHWNRTTDPVPPSAGIPPTDAVPPTDRAVSSPSGRPAATGAPRPR